MLVHEYLVKLKYFFMFLRTNSGTQIVIRLLQFQCKSKYLIIFFQFLRINCEYVEVEL